ncbi:coiled-coil domain-containing protein 154-like isoform X2 [Ochotona curzoniae]|uniref:coiled-coil domain-containing protein 154-like isoform X2 n=1 Tax=Ochotona curzoniae TaxID=130825 RepID=UPI001B34950D|nr:coiled-coil domain-containing protein 154-like isoform X2 [Ochotona curzoniae]
MSSPTVEDLDLLLASPQPLSPGDISEQCGSSHLLVSNSLGPEQGTAKCWLQLEQRVAALQAEVAYLRDHKERCEHATLSLLRELLQVRGRLQLQDSELKRLQLLIQAPEKEMLELHGPQNQMQTLDKRLVEVREALTQVRRRQALQDTERKGAEQEARGRLAKLTTLLRQEEQAREAACTSLHRSQEDIGQRVDEQAARIQAQVTKLGEEMSLRFLKREAKLCGFLQRNFQALEQRVKASESARLKAEDSLREELDGRWQKLQELNEERAQAQREVDAGTALRGRGLGPHRRMEPLCASGAQAGWVPRRTLGLRAASLQQEGGRLLAQCRGLDTAVVQLTKFVRQNQVSLNRVLLAEQKARDTKACAEESQAGELASYVKEGLQAVRLAGERAQQETQSALELLRVKSQALEQATADLGLQVKDLSDHCLALGWRLELQEQTLGLRLAAVQTEWEGAGRKSLQDLAVWQQQVAGQLQELREKLDGFPLQIEDISDKCCLHKNDSDLKISAEVRARELEVGAMRQELATLLSSMQLLKEDNPGRKIAEIQGKLATFQSQIIRLGDSVQAHKTLQNLKFNAETKLRTEEMSALRESVLRLWSEEGPWALTLGSRRLLMSLVAAVEVCPREASAPAEASKRQLRGRWQPGACGPAHPLAPVPEINASS